MAKPKNTECYELIANAAYRQFLKYGYNATTYQHIADICNLKRTAIQHYFPQKSAMAMYFFNKLLHETFQYIKKSKLISNDKFLNMFLIGQIFFAFLLKDAKTKLFTLDIISNRALSAEVLLFDYNWGIEYLGISMEEKNGHYFESIIYNMGGIYELLYHFLKNNMSLDLPFHLKQVISSIMIGRGYGHELAEAILAPCILSAEDLTKAIRYLEKKLV